MADLEKNIKIGVDASGVKTGVQEASNSLQNFGRTVQNESGKSDRATQSMITSIQRQTAATQAGAKGTAEYFENIAKLRGASSDVLRPYLDQLKAVESQQKAATAALAGMGNTAGQTRQALQQLPMQFQDIVVSLQAGQRPMTVMLQQGSQLAGSFGGVSAAAKAMGGYVLGLVNPFTVGAAAMVGLGVAVASVEKSLRTESAWQAYADATGRATDLSISAFKRLRDEMGLLPGVSKSVASSVISELAGMRDLSSDALKGIARSAADVAVLMQTDMPSAAKAMGKAFSDPAKGVDELNDTLKIFSAQQIATIQTMVESGDKAGAQAAMLDVLKQSASGLAEQGLTPLQKATNDFGNSWDLAMSSLNSGSGPLKVVTDLMAGLVQRTAEAVTWLSRLKLPQGLEDSFKGGLNGMVFGWATGGQKSTGGASGSWGSSTGGASGSWGAAPTVETNTAWDTHIKKLREATDRYKATSEQMSGLKKNASELSDAIKKLEANGEGNSALADKLRGNLAGVNEQLANLSKRGRDGGSQAAINKEINAYNSLVASIQGAIDINNQEIAFSGKINAAQKAEIKLNADLKAEKIKLTAAHEAELRAKLAIWKAQEASKEQTKREVDAYKEQVDAQEKVAQSYVKMYEDMNRARLAIGELEKSTSSDTARLQKEASLIGASNAQRKITIQLLDLQEEKQRELDKLAKIDFENAEKRAEAEQRISDIFDKRAENVQAKAYVEEWSAAVQQVEDIFVNGFADMMNNGKSGWESFCKSLKTSFMTMVAKQIYAAFAKKIVVQLVGSFSMGGGGWLGALGSLFGMGGGGSGGSGSGAMSLLSNGKTAYDIYSGNGLVGQAWNYGKGLFGYGGSTTSSGGVISGIAPSEVTSPGWLSSVNWGAIAGFALPLVAAYLGGMFKEEKMVGQGLTGDLGGDLYGYQLMRESGSLFDGPKYRYLVAEKEIAEIKQRIEDIKSGKVTEGIGANNNLQKLYNQLDVLERNYSAQIEGSQGPIKMLQDAFGAMREDTAKRADVLGLDGESIRAMKVALGVDEIHPDTGGKGLQLTGLTQEEAAAKIQEALAQANEELARSVLGSWQEQTREVTRTMFDQVWVADESDAGGSYQRIGKQVTETLTEQVFVMSEYVRNGESAVDALTRMSSSLTGVNSVFDLLGATLLEGSLAAGDWASKLVDAIGSMDALTEAASTYFDLYYSDAEKQAFVSDRANQGMAEKGLDLRTTDVDAKGKYRALVEKAIADKDEEMIAWLLQFADDFSNGVDAVTASLESGVNAMQEQLAELQRIREETLSTIGLSMDGLVDGFITEINEGRGAQAGEWLADTIASGFERAIYEQAIGIIMSSIIDGVITPVVTAAMTGSSVSAAVSGAAIDTMVANARAAADALVALLNDPAFRSAMDGVLDIVRNLGNDIGSSIPVMSTYRPAIQDVTKAYESSTSAADEAAKAAQKLADEWSKLIDSMSNEMKRLRGELLGASDDQGSAYYESMFAIKTAQARAGDQDAAAELPALVQAMEEIAKANAATQADVLLKQSAWLASLTDTRNYIAGKYGVDISNQQGAEVAATTTGRVIQTSGNTAVLNALQSSSDNPVLVAEVRALRQEVVNLRADTRTHTEATAPALQRLEKRTQKWDVDGLPKERV